MKYLVIAIIALSAASLVVAQVSTDQAEQALKAKQERRSAIATQPALHEELDEAWEEIHKLRADVRDLQIEVRSLREWASNVDLGKAGRGNTRRPARNQPAGSDSGN